MTHQQITLFIHLLIAHLLSDFVFQTKNMVKNKKWFSKEMIFHIIIVYITTAIFTFWWWQSLIIAFSHYLIDGLKIEFKRNFKHQETYFFLIDQLLHLITIIAFCLFQFDLLNNLLESITKTFQNYHLNILILIYLLISYPIGYIIGISTNKIRQSGENIPEEKDNNGLKIGIFERIIILTFVLLEQYTAIGFLITGKSLLRFSSRNESKKSEYVLLGTTMSYCITIIIGILTNELLK